MSVDKDTLIKRHRLQISPETKDNQSKQLSLGLFGNRIGISKSEFAAAMGWSTDTVSRRIKSGEIVAEKSGRLVIIPIAKNGRWFSLKE